MSYNNNRRGLGFAFADMFHAFSTRAAHQRADKEERRHNRRTLKIINDLPCEIRKDIGVGC